YRLMERDHGTDVRVEICAEPASFGTRRFQPAFAKAVNRIATVAAQELSDAKAFVVTRARQTKTRRRPSKAVNAEGRKRAKGGRAPTTRNGQTPSAAPKLARPKTNGSSIT